MGYYCPGKLASANDRCFVKKLTGKNFDKPLDFRWSMCYTIIVPKEKVL